MAEQKLFASKTAFPTEIFEEILDNFTNEKRALRSCSLVDSTFCGICQRRLFRNVNLCEPEDASRFVNILKMRPHLGEYVRQLGIYDYADVESGWSYWRYKSALPSLLRHLNRVRRIDLDGNDKDWEDMPPKLQEDFIHFLQSPSLLSIFLSNVLNFPLSALSGTASLRKLSLNNISWVASLPPSHKTRSLLPALKLDTLVLRLNDVPKSAGSPSISQSINLSNLRRLSLSTSNASCINSCLQRCGNALEDLYIFTSAPTVSTFHYNGRTTSLVQSHRSGFSVSLEQLSGLKMLAVRTTLRNTFESEQSGMRYMTSFPWLIDLLQTLPPYPSNSLSNIIIHLRANFRTPEQLREVDWSDFAAALTSRSLARLRHVEFRLWTPEYFDFLEVVDAFRASAPLCKLMDKGLLSIQGDTKTTSDVAWW
ncbi:hypothetical protein NLJ89_g5004 [Agrocybe chaxingu]|uniref:F-box domain-containing protein n=1 Tax=Agrocybe chaxingu TaxID=84603 RepID=A0A9W8MW02_9AGAR|nr:hypothetical protein NLJ89_g5004 [Agrocybe chaxingu]